VDRRVLGHPETRTLGGLLIDCERGPDAPSRANRDARNIDRVSGRPASTLRVGFRFLLELSKIERQSQCTGDIARG
jgi:hypothetical protein